MSDLDSRDQDKVTAELGEGWKIVSTVPILHIGWEMDNYAWAIKATDGNIHWFWTNHGSLAKVSKKEIKAEISRMKSAVAEAESALQKIET